MAGDPIDAEVDDCRRNGRRRIDRAAPHRLDHFIRRHEDRHHAELLHGLADDGAVDPHFHSLQVLQRLDRAAREDVVLRVHERADHVVVGVTA